MDHCLIARSSLRLPSSFVAVNGKAIITGRFSILASEIGITAFRSGNIVLIIWKIPQPVPSPRDLISASEFMPGSNSRHDRSAARGRKTGTALIGAAESVALAHDCVSLRLEVRRDNTTSISLYEKLGYRRFAVQPDYYEDHMEALRYEKRLLPQIKPKLVRVPYYKQTLDFTCGPSALMMAMKSLRPAVKLTRKLELRLWRESTTIYMASGHGGCGPYGLALAAYRMNFDVEIYVNGKSVMFVDSVRSEEKKEVMRLVQEDFIAELKKMPVKIHFGVLSVQAIQRKFEVGGIPIVLISSYPMYGEKSPHWVVVTGFDEKYIYVHDPYVDHEAGKLSLDSINMPILKKDFERMARYGKAAQKAVLIISRRDTQA